jgi:outer membrane protein OmpA-like peptidoglycan-associated protein
MKRWIENFEIIGMRIFSFPFGNLTWEDKMKKTGLLALMVCIFLLAVIPSYGQEVLQVSTPNTPSKISYQVMRDDMLVVSVIDEQDNPIRGLGPQDFVVRKGTKTATIVSAEPLETVAELGLNIILVLDNSSSMQQRRAVEPLLSALEEFLEIVRPLDNIEVVVFDPNGDYQAKGRILRTKMIQTNDVSRLRQFFAESYSDLSSRTYLYEGILTAIDRAAALPERDNKLIVVFSDGKDLNSAFGTDVVWTEANKVPNLKVYAIDFMPGPKKDGFLTSFAEDHGGFILKATSADQLVATFETFATGLRYQYVISYLFQPTVTIAIEPSVMKIEEVTTIDSSPLLNHIYFETAQSNMPDRYVIYESQDKTQTFDETKLKTTMDKHVNLLNIVGKRLRDMPEAHLTIVGCNSDFGEERGRIDISRARAEAVRLYLRYLWGVHPSRMEVKAQSLPDVPSANRLPEGRAENQRVELYSDNPGILHTVKSLYMETISEVETLRVTPNVTAEYGLESWKITLKGMELLDSVSGTGPLASAYTFPVKRIGLDKLAQSSEVTADILIVDNKGQEYLAETASPMAITVLKKEQLLTQKLGYKVLEKYALILFDFDSAEIKGDNEVILQRIVERMKEFPDAFVRITGHTDTIGDESYNMKLSQRRAKAVYDQIMAVGVSPDTQITYFGEGPQDPLYDNMLPEGRALNRTVTIDLAYEKQF